MRLPSFCAFCVFALIVAVPATSIFAHPGGLDANGCHHDRKNGGYHCQRGASANRSAQSQVMSSGPTGRAFRNCSEARAAGAAPVRAGDPGYGRHLDRDGDGVGCE
ncbi:excalibur calcium-binding domain-containing protein [Sphingomonas alba]